MRLVTIDRPEARNAVDRPTAEALFDAFTEFDATTGFAYGVHWWLWPDYAGSLACHGYEGQYTVVLPSSELVVVHLGKCPAAQRTIVNDHLRTILSAAQ